MFPKIEFSKFIRIQKMKLFSSNNKKQPLSYWISHARNKKKLLVFHGDQVLDLTEFANKHPGGQKAILPYILQDIKSIIFRIYPHPSSTVQTLRKYVCGKVQDYKENAVQEHGKGICKDKSSLSVRKEDQNKKVSFELNKPVEKVQPKLKSSGFRTRQKELSLKMEENLTNFEQNKPIISVPHFNVRIDCFAKDKDFIKQTA